MKGKQPNRYQALVAEIFRSSFKKGCDSVPFSREQIVETAAKIGVEIPKNLGDVLYSFRYRYPLPQEITKTQPRGKEWIIVGVGRALYEFKLVPINRIAPNPQLITIKLPDATPEIIAVNALSDEQALLAKVRYNRLIDIFLGVAAYSLQNHLRTTVKGLGQIEIDEVYVGVDRHGCQYIIPVQAKGGNDQLSVVQARQDIACCSEKFPSLKCRAISAQFMDDERIALFELCLDDAGLVRIVDERHYRLLPGDQIDSSDLESYRQRAG
ncbi:MAG: endonuclease [Verrucomicrobiales bacterium VVV1]|nr:MAG: endonuclease [Verrucomicrobiales bacterium VVV1]